VLLAAPQGVYLYLLDVVGVLHSQKFSANVAKKTKQQKKSNFKKKKWINKKYYDINYLPNSNKQPEIYFIAAGSSQQIAPRVKRYEFIMFRNYFSACNSVSLLQQNTR